MAQFGDYGRYGFHVSRGVDNPLLIDDARYVTIINGVIRGNVVIDLG